MDEKQKGKKRLSVTVSDSLDLRLQRLADAYGVPKGTLCTMLLAQTATASERALEMASEVAEKMVKEQMANAGQDEGAD